MIDKTYTPSEVEARWYQTWTDSGAFAGRPDSNAQPYTIMMPPPNVTGSLHIGHALTFTLQDALIRWRRMQGRDALWQPGMDHAGIATQMVVERQLEAKGERRRDIGRARFLERVWAWKDESGGTINRQLRRLGASADWARERFTMDESLSAGVRRVFVQLYRDGLIYKDKRLVNWDPKLHTAISDLEVVQTEVKGQLWHLKYPIDGKTDRFVIVATTRPETMLGDTAIAVHPDDPRWQPLIGQHAIVPIIGRRIPIVADSYADPEQGSGAVKITPAHDFNDFEVGRRNRLPVVSILDADARVDLSGEDLAALGEAADGGRWGDLASARAAFHGLDRYAARSAIVAKLEAMGLVDAITPHTHMVPHGDRGGVPIEPFLTEQWYCNAATLAKPAIDAVRDGRTAFVPKHWEATYFEWMENIQPWCISRQLWWGHQIPAWYGPDGRIFVAEDEGQARAAARAHYGSDTPLTRDEDVLDTWFSSALWPFSTLGWPDRTPELARYYPGDVLVTGFDIIFFWVARMMMMGLHVMGDVPFRTVYIHALVRDQHGQKMSKSKGNIIDPLALIDRFGGDALRFTLASLAAQGRDIKLAESRVEGSRNFCTKLWNAARFCQVNGCARDPQFDPDTATLTLSRWICAEADHATRRVTAAFEGYKFNEAANELYQFAWGSFCDWYLELAKPVLQGTDAAAAAETRAAAAWVLDRILHLGHPLMPSLTEELWSALDLAKGDRLITAAWPQPAAPSPSALAAQREINAVIGLISEIRSARTEMNVPPAKLVPVCDIDADPPTSALLGTHHELIGRLARVSGIKERLDPRSRTGSGTSRGAERIQVTVPGAVLQLDVAGLIDLPTETQRLAKEAGRLRDEVAKLDAKLGNADFVARAPEEVVDEQRDRRESAAVRLEKIAAALDRLAGA